MGYKGKRILLAEDDRVLRRAGEMTLKQAGFEVLTAADGEEALRLARAEGPDLILLDLIMPKVQGFEVLRALKADPETMKIPVIVFTNLGQDRDIQEAMAGGAATYIIKAQLHLRDLPRRVNDVLEGA